LEALARWRRENGEPVAPADFIALAEETGIIVPLGSWVLRRALEQLREWREAAGDRTDLMVSVNVSGRQLARVDLVDEVKAALADTGIPPGLLKLEITETVLVDDLAPIGEVLRNLRRIGVGLWLDDFGTGYSSLSYLNRFRFEALKIDRSFVASIDEEPERQATVRAIVALARGLGMKSVAEGVETDAQLRRLSALRCDYAQGHLISLPLGHQAVTQLLHRFAVPTTPR
ncbi:MAG: EAL domain-containing protein, partial [Thermoanaerobaculia bacterium]|nr:EAL domain-containing protein [Thermoanaerobaculia bacterium]